MKMTPDMTHLGWVFVEENDNAFRCTAADGRDLHPFRSNAKVAELFIYTTDETSNTNEPQA
jgi:hypothetical protein